MERRVSKKIEKYQTTFKNDIKNFITENNIKITNENGNDNLSNFLQFVYDYDSLFLSKEDFQKRRRSKNTVPFCERCMAKRANGEQCTRRKKIGEDYCGTHVKGTPHGCCESEATTEKLTKIEIWVQEIQGINYYIDEKNNVYNPHDIIMNTPHPKVVGQWKLVNGEYQVDDL